MIGGRRRGIKFSMNLETSAIWIVRWLECGRWGLLRIPATIFGNGRDQVWWRTDWMWTLSA